MIFFAFLMSLDTLWEPLGLPVWQRFRSFLQFLQNVREQKTAPSYLVSENTVFFSIFHAREHQKSLKNQCFSMILLISQISHFQPVGANSGQFLNDFEWICLLK